MIHEVEFCRTVVVPKRDPSKRSIIENLLAQLLANKSSEEYGYFLAVTKLKRISKVHVQKSCCCNMACYHVVFCCRMFLPVTGETLEGIVYYVKRQGALIKCGPTKHVFLSARKMPGYRLVPGEAPFFQNDQLDRIQIGVVIRFRVLSVRWVENRPNYSKREFLMLASLETGESFGPVSLPGLDNSEI